MVNNNIKCKYLYKGVLTFKRENNQIFTHIVSWNLHKFDDLAYR